MRPAVVILAALTTGGLSLALADPPDRPAPQEPESKAEESGTPAIGNPVSGEGKSAACSSCHGPYGNSANPEVPRLAGQSAVYVAGRLTLFRSGALKHPAMNPPAANLSDRDINDLAVYYAAQTSAAAPVKPAPNTPDERMIEQQLRSQGYKLRVVNGERTYCKAEAPLGSHLVTQLHCMTVAQAEMMTNEGRETTQRIQSRTSGCLTPAAGGCGH